MSGLPIVFQQTPLSVTGTPPSSVMLPPLLAETAVMSLTAVVVSKAVPDKVLNVTSLP